MKQPIQNNTMPGKPSSAAMPLPMACIVVSVNRVGFEQDGAMKFWGGSFVSNPFGTLLSKASHDNEEVIVTTVDLSKI